DPAVIKETMLRQVTESVHWLDCIQTAVQDGVSEIVEFGPGGVLARMMKRIDKAVAASAVTDVASVEAYAQRG
ncbi:MAG: ACP S-malonyltransferase, partial [Kiritimatiellae bacterium]|nr:ACP S-malonyltransferase [Kiritimatiellia bacterium]